VLLDAPCTATGAIRRHPDVPRLKTPDDVSRLAAVQERLVSAALEMLEPGGMLVYCTCSLEPEEGEAQVAPFLARHPDFALMPVAPHELAGLATPITPEGCMRTLPCHGFGEGAAMRGMDGFFAARFLRN
jgi:16S rRNA (cytosine967-C5)-methyltransferase